MPSPQQVLEHLPREEPVADVRSQIPFWPVPAAETSGALAGDGNSVSTGSGSGAAGTGIPEPDGPRPDRTINVIAGFGILFFILLICTMYGFAATGSNGSIAAGQNGSVATSSPVSAAVVRPQATVSAAPAETPVVIASVPSPAVMPAGISSAPATVPQETRPAGPVSYVTIEPVPKTPVPVLQDLSTDLPVPDYSDYFTIYSLTNQEVQQNLQYVSFPLSNPPLVIEYKVTPMNMTEIKDVDYKILTTMYHEKLTINREFEQAWFRVVVRDRDTGKIVAEDGYGRTDSLAQGRRLVVYRGGNYRFEFSGEHVAVDLAVKVRKDGNIP